MEVTALPSLADPLTWVKYTMLGCLVGLSQAGGIGGGPIISPVMMVLLGLPSKQAIWYTYIMLLGGSLGNFLRLGKERTPSGTPLINYQLVMITLPLLLSGAIFGVATGKWLPKIMVVIFLFGILVSVFLKTLGLYKRLRDKEDQAQTESQQSLTQVEMKNVEAIATEETQVQVPYELLQVQEREKRLYPVDYIQELALQVVIILVITVIKGSATIPSLLAVHFCSVPYHLFNIIILGIAFYNVKRYNAMIDKDEAKKAQAGFSFSDGKLSNVFDTTVKSSLFAGFLGGLVGLGGGVVLTPLWLGMGIQSSRATASATFSVLFTATISVFIIALSGGYTLDAFIVLGLVSGIGSYLVAGLLKGLVKKFKRESILIQVLLGVISFGLLILPFQSIQDVYHDPEAAVKFGRFC